MRNVKAKLFAIGAIAALGVVGTLMYTPLAKVQGAADGPTVTINPTQLPLPVKIASALGIEGTISVKDVDQHARHLITLEFNSSGNDKSYKVPAGKILVLDWIGANGVGINGSVLLIVDGDSGFPPSNKHRWSMIFGADNIGGVYRQGPFYVNGGQTLTVGGQVNSLYNSTRKVTC
jgi:hypothetical protein